MEPVAFTAHWVAAARARESLRPDALFQDPFAAALAGDEGERWKGDPRDEAMLGAYIALRTRFFDDELLRAADSGVRQIVILAAGLDARAYRLEWPDGTHLFELDQPEVIDHKNGILTATRATPRCTRITMGVDLRKPWADGLCAAGFDPKRPSAWLVEGLLPYLEEADVPRLFKQIAPLASAGSTLALDCAGVDPFTSSGFAALAEKLRSRGIQMHFACSDPVALLEGFGWTAKSVTIAELATRAGRTIPWRDGDGDPLRTHLVSASRRIDHG
ncbi:O-Methyltransferase involved in polyketide biosynthesis [Minicystis rosea]|nr:O-Methyltransferase involved in polyketide biosynthesis [Minicystis rosea]